MFKIRNHAEYIRKWSVVDGAGCWQWQRSRLSSGYGRAGVDGERLAHRLSYRTFVAPLLPGLEIDHLCRNRGCVNPEHLDQVDHAENVRRGEPANRTHCPRGHMYAGTNLIIRGRSRACRTCNQIRDRQRSKTESGF